MRWFSIRYLNCLFSMSFTSVLPPWACWKLTISSNFLYHTLLWWSCLFNGAFPLLFFGVSDFVILPPYFCSDLSCLLFLMYLLGRCNFLWCDEVWVQLISVRRVLQDIGLLLFIHCITISNDNLNFSSLYCYVLK